MCVCACVAIDFKKFNSDGGMLHLVPSSSLADHVERSADHQDGQADDDSASFLVAGNCLSQGSWRRERDPREKGGVSFVPKTST